MFKDDNRIPEDMTVRQWIDEGRNLTSYKDSRDLNEKQEQK